MPDLYTELDDYPISRSILQGQISADGTIIGFRTKPCTATNSVPVHPEVARSELPAMSTQDDSLMVVLVAHHSLRSVAMSIGQVIRPDFAVVNLADKDYVALFRDGVMVCSTRSPGGKTLAAGRYEQRCNFLLRAPRHVFKPECQEELFDESAKRPRKTTQKEA